jgi:PAS domain S-box-containing protein
MRWAAAAGVPTLLACGGLALWSVHGLKVSAVGVFVSSAAAWVLLTRRLRALETGIREQSFSLEESQRLARIGSFRWDAASDTNHWSDELYRIYGTTPGEVAPSFERYMSMVHPDFRDAVQQSVDEAIAARRPFDHDYRISHPSGEVRWVHAYGEIITDEFGTMIGLQGTCQDVTERKRAEEAVRATEERARALLESAPDAVVVVDESGRIVLVNNEATVLFGYEADEIVGRPVDILVPDAARPLHLRHRLEYMQERTRRTMGDEEIWALRKDGGHVPVSVNLSPVETEDGTLIIAVVQNITERRLAEESMREAYERERSAADNLRALDETKTVFLEAVSHELRTPLTVIVGISSLLREGDLDPAHEGYAELVKSLDTSALRLEHLLDDLLDLHRLGRGIVKPHRRPTPVAELAARVVGALEVGRHEVRVDAHEVVADIDPAQAERIIENLVANAVRHTRPDTSVWVRAESADNGVVIVVEDDGPGVPDNIRETLFAPFVKDTRGHVPGTGIGLSLVLRFAALHGGRAWVDDRPGGGARFHVYLPSSEAEERQAVGEVA